MIAGCPALGRRALTRAIVVLAIAFVSADALAGSPAAATSTSTPIVTATQLATNDGCGTGLAVRPRVVYLSCADGNEYLGSLTWTSWSTGRASGSGQFMLNDCIPTCAGDSIVSQGAIDVVAFRPASFEGSNHFTRLRIGLHAYDPSLHMSWTLTLPDALGHDDLWNEAPYYFTGSVARTPGASSSEAATHVANARAQVIQLLSFLGRPWDTYSVQLWIDPAAPQWAMFDIVLAPNAAAGPTGHGFVRLTRYGWVIRPGPGEPTRDFGCATSGSSSVPSAVATAFHTWMRGHIVC